VFDTLLVFENYPVDEGGCAVGAGPAVTAVEARDVTHYPLSLMVVPGERLRLRLDHRPDLFESGVGYGSVGSPGASAVWMVSDPDQAVGSLSYCRRTSGGGC